MIHNAENRKIATKAAHLALRLLAEVPVLAMALSLAAAGSISASAASYYADATNGSDSNNGSISSPVQSIDKGATLLSPGDTLYVRNGTYTANWADQSGFGGIAVRQGNDGAPGALKTVKPYPGETPIIASSVIVMANYWRWEGLTFSGTPFFYVRTPGAWSSIPIPAGNTPPMGHEVPGSWPHDIQIVGNTFKGNLGNNDGAIHTYANNVLVENNDLSQLTVPSNTYKTANIYMSAGDNIVVRGNKVSGATDYNLQIYDERRDTTEVYTRWISNVIVEDNIVYNPSGGHIAGDNSSYFGDGIVVAVGGKGQNVIVRNNIVYGVRTAGIVLDSNYDSIKVFNNTIFQPVPGASCFLFRNLTSNLSTNVSIENNICDLGANYSSSSHINTGNLPFTLDNNLYWPLPIKYNGGVTTDSHPIQGDPLFANASTDPALANFHLQSGSAAIDKGLSLAADVPGDKDGVCRPQGAGFDIGAYEFCASGSCPATCGSGSGVIINALAPAAPRGLRIQ